MLQEAVRRAFVYPGPIADCFQRQPAGRTLESFENPQDFRDYPDRRCTRVSLYSGFGPQLALSYDSGTGNGPFGLGWSLSLPAITRRTDKGLPKYQDGDESDVFILSGAEDLVPVLVNMQNINTILPWKH